MKASAAIRPEAKELVPIAEATPPMEANSTIRSIEWVSGTLAWVTWKTANVDIVKIMRPKTVESGSNVGAWDIIGVIAAVGRNV